LLRQKVSKKALFRLWRLRHYRNEQHGAVLFQIFSLFQKSERRHAFADVMDFC